MIQEMMEKRHLTKYQLAKNSGIPYSTISDICSGKTSLKKCSAETIYKLSKELMVPMEELLEPYMYDRIDFELYKSNVCHMLKEYGDIDFIINVLEENEIQTLYARKWYPESLYLLAMLDYVSRLNDVPLCDEYDELRKCRLAETVYPAGVLLQALVFKDDTVKEKACKDSIPEFIRFNIVENEVRNVI